MIEVERGKTKTLTLKTSGTATGVTIGLKYDWGDVIRADTAASGSGTSFSYTLTEADTNTCGVVKVTWKYTMSSIGYTKDEYIKVFQPYSNSASFFADFPELETEFGDSFVVAERRMRQVIDTYCGQEFQAIPGKVLILDGSGSDVLHTHYRVNTITQVLRDNVDDLTELVEKHPESDFHIRRRRNTVGTKEYLEPAYSGDAGKFFRPRRTYYIKGDWGWLYVPTNIEEASKILIADYFNQDSDNRRHNVIFTGVGPVQTNYRGDLVGTTGNVDADVLLMDYTKFVMDWV